MINVAATVEAFGRADVGHGQPVIATCPECMQDRTTRMRNADGMCQACARTHQPGQPIHMRITAKSVDDRKA